MRDWRYIDIQYLSIYKYYAVDAVQPGLSEVAVLCPSLIKTKLLERIWFGSFGRLDHRSIDRSTVVTFVLSRNF